MTQWVYRYPYHATDVSKRQEVQKFKNKFKHSNIPEFCDYIWNHHKKFKQISTNMPGIGSIIRELDVKMSEIWKKQNDFAQYN